MTRRVKLLIIAALTTLPLATIAPQAVADEICVDVGGTQICAGPQRH